MLGKLISNAKKWIGYKEQGVQAVAQPMTGGYTTIDYAYWSQMRELPPFDFWAILQMLHDPQVRLCLAIRAAPLYGVEFGYKDGEQFIPGIKCQHPEVATYIERQLKKIWLNHLQDILQAQVWGWSAAEVCLKIGSSGLIEVNRMEFRQAQDVRLLKAKGKPAAVLFTRLRESNELAISFPEAFFHAHNPQAGQDYGQSILRGAFSPWCDKWLNGGALDVRRLFMHRDAYAGGDLGYPDGTTYIDGRQTSNRDIARDILDKMRAGHAIARPSERDENGNEKWPFQRAQVTSNPSHILQYPKDLDDEMRQGIEIPDGVIDDAGTGAWGGKRIPMAAFYSTLDCWVVRILNDLTEQVLEKLVEWNFGPGIDFEIDHKPLAEQAMEQQSNAGGGMQPQQPGMDQGMPGMPGGDQPGMPGVDSEANLFDQYSDEQPMQMAIRAAQLIRIPDKPLRMAAHAPAGGIDIDGTFYEGGQFIPGMSQIEVDDIHQDQTNQALGRGKYAPPKAKPEEKETESESEVQSKINGTPHKPERKHVYTVPVDSIKADPERFQYKVKGIDKKEGVTKELQGVSTWNPELGGVLLVWRDPDDGNDYVVNGHHRLHLAKRLGAEELNVRYIDAGSSKVARSVGALANIAEGRGTAVDAAKYLRDTDSSIEHLRKAGVSLSGKIAADAVVLTDLSESAFNRVIQGTLEERTAIAVAGQLKDQGLQEKLFKKISAREDDGKDWSPREIETAAKKMASAGSVQTSGTDLFGDWEDEESTFDSEVALEAHVGRMLGQLSNDFKAVASSRRADRVADAGNVLAVEENAKRAGEAQAIADTFAKEANLRGTVADAIKYHAIDYQRAKTKAERERVKAETLESVREAVSKVLYPEPSKPTIPGMQTSMFDEDPDGQGKLFNFMPPAKKRGNAFDFGDDSENELKPIKQYESLPGQKSLAMGLRKD